MLSFSGVAFVLFFVLFRFRLYGFIEAAALPSIVLRYVCAPTATHSLKTICVLFCSWFLFVSLLLVFLEMWLFPSIFVPLSFFFVWRVRRTFFLFIPEGVFPPCDHGLDI